MAKFKENAIPVLALVAVILASAVMGYLITYKYYEHAFSGAEYFVDEAKNIIYIITK